MITLPAPVTIDSIVINGVIQPSFTIGPNINYTVTYSDERKIASVGIDKIGVIVLWTGKDYDAAGQFTDSDTDKRLNTIIGSDPSAFFNGIVKKREIKQPAANKVDPIPAPVAPTVKP